MELETIQINNKTKQKLRKENAEYLFKRVEKQEPKDECADGI